MDINQIIANASQVHVDALNKALDDLRVAAEAARKAGFAVALSPARNGGPEDHNPDDVFFPSVAQRVLRDEVSVELTYSVSIVSKSPEAPAPAPAPAPLVGEIIAG